LGRSGNARPRALRFMDDPKGRRLKRKSRWQESRRRDKRHRMAGGLAERAIDAAIMLAMPWRPRRGAVLMQAERHIGAEQGAERAERCDGVRLGGTGHRARRRRRAELQDKGEDRGPGEEGRANPAARAAARSSRRSLAASRHARSQMSQRAGRLVDQRGSVKRRRCRGRGSRTALPSPCSPSSLGECEAFVRATRFTGGSAGLDGVDGPTSTASECQRWPWGSQEGDRP
jgi:hypothetical protein